MSAQATRVFQVALIKFKAKLVGSRYTHGEQKECKSQGQKKEHTGQALTRNCSFYSYSKGRKQATHIHRKKGQAHLSPVLTMACTGPSLSLLGTPAAAQATTCHSCLSFRIVTETMLNAIKAIIGAYSRCSARKSTVLLYVILPRSAEFLSVILLRKDTANAPRRCRIKPRHPQNLE